MINPNEINLIQDLERNEVAFPAINYHENPPLILGAPTILSAYTNITKRIGFDYFDDIDWDSNGNLVWQNNMLQWLSNSINDLIIQYSRLPDEQLLKRIFLRIQLWGGNESRHFFIREGGFEANYISEIYEEAIALIAINEFDRANRKLNEIRFIATAFATKHIFFWSNNHAPIFDSLIAKIVFGRKYADPLYYPLYLNVLSNIATEIGTTSSMIERNLFNWANTEVGKNWIAIRMRNY
jgi:hypothetical protein